MIVTDVHWTDARAIVLRHVAAVAVEHGWRVQWCRRHAEIIEPGEPEVVSEAVRLELRRTGDVTTVVRVEACDVWSDGSHGLMPWSEHTAGRPGLVRHDHDDDADALVARLRALGEVAG